MTTQPTVQTRDQDAPQADPELVREFNDRSPNLMSTAELQQWEIVFNAALNRKNKTEQDVAAYKESLHYVQTFLAL